jgi:hypothetical protein
MLLLLLLTYINIVHSLQCSWNYRFDSKENHLNIVYPDKTAVYFGMIIPENTSFLNISSRVLQQSYRNPFYNHPSADYFSIQVYEIGNFIEAIYHINDQELIGLENLGRKDSNYSYNLDLNPQSIYFALYRIYNSHIPAPYLLNYSSVLHYWGGIPPSTYINGEPLQLCDVDYQEQGNIYTNFSQDINPTTGTVCNTNNNFTFMNIPSGSLANYDANYMIACIQPGSLYTINIRMPILMCSLGYHNAQPHPWIDEPYDLRYASINLVSTNRPRPTIDSWKIPCNQENFTITIYVDDDIPQPALLYRQILPDTRFSYSIQKAKERCFDYVDNKYDALCIRRAMGSYYPTIL